MKQAWRWLPLALGLVVLSATGAQDEQWLQYRTTREPWRFLGSVRSTHLPFETQAPEGLTLPKFNSGEPLFAKWTTPMAKAGHRWITLDQSRKAGPYDLLYVDVNGNGDLSDERPVAAFSKQRQGAQFGPVQVLFEGDEGSISYHFNFRYYSYQRDKKTIRRGHITTGCWYEGSVTVGGKKYRCMLVDYNANGTFNDTSMNFQMIDRIRIGQGKNLTERFVGKYLPVGDALYTPEVAKDGACIAFQPAGDVPMGTLVVSDEIGSLSAGGENGLLDAKTDQGVAKLPAGKYRFQQWQIKRKDDRGVVWALSARRFPDKSIFEITEGAETRMDIGEPITSSLQLGKRRKAWYIGQNLKGKLGEDVSIARAGKRAPAPKLRIRNQDGTYNRLFQFEYG